MIAHHVLFWLKPDMSQEQKLAFRTALETLRDVESVNLMHIGTPAPIHRSVVDDTYTFSLLLFFDDLQGHDAYQVHPLHKAFLEEFRMYFDKVIIYDAE
jgi:hypothetical protein